MKLNTNRRGFLKSAASIAALTAGGCCNTWCGRSGKIRLAVVGVMGKGYSDWTPMLKSGLVDIVAFCDADYKTRERAQMQLIKEGIDFSLLPVYLAGTVVSTVVGVFAIKLVKSITSKGKFGNFAYYCWTVGVLTILLSLLF